MISINCTQCQQHLEIDEGFAGGVCRCQFCGTIQTVPSHLKNKKPKSAGPSPKPNKALYKKGSGGQPGTGLDELAEVVASSGLSRKSLAGKGTGASPTRRTPPAPAKRNPLMPVIVIGAIVVAALVVLVVYFAMKSQNAGNASAGSAGTGSSLPVTPDDTTTPAKPVSTEPSFAGVPLPRGTVVYLIDRSQANAEVLDTAKAAVYQSVQSLGPNRHFQIILWHRKEEGIVAYPESDAGNATQGELEAAEKRLEVEVAYGTTDLKPTLEKALKANPAEIVLITAKGFQIDERTPQMVKKTLKGASVHIHTFALGEEESAALKQVAEQTGGEYLEMSYKELGKFVR